LLYNESVKRLRWLILSGMVGLLSLQQPVQAQQGESRYFPETGHTVSGEFLRFYESIPDATLVFGYPITEAFTTHHPPGLTVQYFQRARFELHPELPAGQQVTLTAVGSFLYAPGNASIHINSPGACRAFPNGYSTCYDFLAFYEAHGDARLFGYPISGFEILTDGRIVQYFERARFEWRPELPPGSNVILTDAGRLYFDKIGEDPARLNPTSPNAIIAARVLSLHPRVFVQQAVTAPTDTQTIYAVVRTQTAQPVEGASVLFRVRLADGERLFRSVTNRQGIAAVNDLHFNAQPPGFLVTVQILTEYAGLQSEATTSFRIWH